MKVLPVFLHERKYVKNNSQNTPKVPSGCNNTNLSVNYPKNYYLLSFQARVEKGLNSFIQRNNDNLPYSLKAYVENLSEEQRAQLTPLQAQRNAFECLLLCDSVDDVKDVYPKEPLFADLKSVDELKSKRGILYDIRLMQAELEDEKLLTNGDSDLTIYLLKKIFLEGKTIPEINKDLDKDLNPAFQKEDKSYILSSTLDALGIKLPSFPYLTSLRYTREGYSDCMAQKISKRWQEMSPEERQKIVSSHTARQPMTEEQKGRLSNFSKERWAKMSAEQKAEAINAMQKGNLEKRIIMTDAWNNLPEARNKLSAYLKENNLYSPQSIIYKADDYSPAMKIVMSRFWAENSELAAQLGEQISLSYEKYSKAEQNGKLQEFIDSVEAKCAEIKKEIKQSFKVSNSNPLKLTSVDKYRTMFSYLPEKLLDKQCAILSKMNDKDVNLWIKYCMGQKLDTKELRKVEKITEIVAPKKSNEMQCLIAASINMLEECLTPIENPVTGEKFAPIFPTNLDFRFPDIARMYFNLRKQGWENFELIKFSALSGGRREDVAKDFLSERFTKEIIKRNPDVQFNFDLMKHRYTFFKRPDFERLDELYNDILSYGLSPQEAQKAAFEFCSDGTRKDAIALLADSFYAFPHMHYSYISPKSSDGMKLRVLCSINNFLVDKYKSHSTIYERNLKNYEERFIDFFSTKE